MYLKTTSPQFLKYGKVSDEESPFQVKRNYYEGKDVNDLFHVPFKTFVKLLSGIAVLIIKNDDGVIENFVIHRNVIINEHVQFNIVPITQSIVIEMGPYQKRNDPFVRIPLSVPYIYKPIKPKLSISEIYSYYYNVKGKDYHFDGEEHYFWELTYVDTGQLRTDIDGNTFELSNQEMVLYFPGQFHKQDIIGKSSCSYLTIMFDMNIDSNSESLKHIKNKVFKCSSELYQLVNNFIRVSTIMENDELPYARDMMIAYLKEIMVHLVHYDDVHSDEHKVSNPIQVNFENELMNEITNYIHKNVYEPITIEEICLHFSISRSTLQTLFKKNLNMAPKQYINEEKMSLAQHMILEEKYPITEIAYKLGFSSIHYFSRKFKSRFGLAPSEFSQSVFKQKGEEAK